MNNDKRIVCDIDGTICPIKRHDEHYEELLPYKSVVKQLNEYKKQGFEIILYTARNMRTYQGDIGKINKYTAPTLVKWLDQHQIPYDEIHYGKPWPGKEGFYLDDRTIRPKEFIDFKLSKLNQIMDQAKDVNQNRLNIVITMAGMSSRFKKAGFKVPKFMIKVKGLTLFQWSLLSLSSFLKDNPKLIFVTQREFDSKNFIAENIALFGISDFEIVEVDGPTDGQATSAYLARELWIKENPLLVYNIDTYIEPNIILPADNIYGNWIPCMKEEGEHWSFVKVDATGIAVDVQEKKRISDNCSIGLYSFESCLIFEDCYENYFLEEDNLINGEKYIAPMYNWLIEKGHKVGISVVEIEKVHPLGTPAELEQFCSENKFCEN